MEAAYLDAPDDLAPGAFGIPEPQGEAADPASIDLTLVPGAAFDKSGGRLGRGGGYYDRYLPLVRGLTVGLAFECQMLETVPREAHDIGIQRVVTESAVYGEEDAT